MVKFAHIADVHLGGWKQEPMQKLNFESFKKTIDICLKSKLDFILFSGDLFDSAYPPIEILKETFAQFKRIYEAGIPSFIIAGSHDYSVSGKTFLDVLEKAGFCKNTFQPEKKEEITYLNPVIYNNIAIYGYPGKKSGLEVPELRKVKLNEAPGMFKIFMLHTTMEHVVKNLPIDYLKKEELPITDYYALGHIHTVSTNSKFVYPGPLFPNNFQELRDLKQGSFCIIDTNSNQQIESIKIPTKQVEYFEIEITNGITGTEEIISKINQKNLEDKIVLLKVKGELEKGKNSDIKFQQIEEFIKNNGAYFMLKNSHDLNTKEYDTNIEIKDEKNIEKETIEQYSKENPSNFNKLIPSLMDSLSIEKQEDEKTDVFNNRLIEEVKKILKF